MSWSLYDEAGQRKYLTDAERQAFMRAAKRCDPDVFTFCWVLKETGCRLSEALALTVDRIDFEAGVVILRTLKKRTKGSHRAVPASRDLLDKLERVHDVHVRQTKGESGRLWSWCRMTGYRRIKEVMERAGIQGPHATPKGLRHGFGVAALERGVPLNMLQKWLGHADMATTAIYGNAVGLEERHIAERLWD